MHTFSEVVTYIIVFDMLLKPFTGVKKDDNAIVLLETKKVKINKLVSSETEYKKLKHTKKGKIRTQN